MIAPITEALLKEVHRQGPCAWKAAHPGDQWGSALSPAH